MLNRRDRSWLELARFLMPSDAGWMWSVGKKDKAVSQQQYRWSKSCCMQVVVKPSSCTFCQTAWLQWNMQPCTTMCSPSTGRQWRQVCQKTAEHCAV